MLKNGQCFPRQENESFRMQVILKLTIESVKVVVKMIMISIGFIEVENVFMKQRYLSKRVSNELETYLK